MEVDTFLSAIGNNDPVGTRAGADGNSDGPLLATLVELWNRGVTIGRCVIVSFDMGDSTDMESRGQLAAEMIGGRARDLGIAEPTLDLRPIKGVNPTDFSEVLSQLEAVAGALPLDGTHSTHIASTSGTPTIMVAWTYLCSWGIIPRARMYQALDPSRVTAGSRVREVDLSRRRQEETIQVFEEAFRAGAFRLAADTMTNLLNLAPRRDTGRQAAAGALAAWAMALEGLENGYFREAIAALAQAIDNLADLPDSADARELREMLTVRHDALKAGAEYGREDSPAPALVWLVEALLLWASIGLRMKAGQHANAATRLRAVLERLYRTVLESVRVHHAAWFAEKEAEELHNHGRSNGARVLYTIGTIQHRLKQLTEDPNFRPTDVLGQVTLLGNNFVSEKPFDLNASTEAYWSSRRIREDSNEAFELHAQIELLPYEIGTMVAELPTVAHFLLGLPPERWPALDSAMFGADDATRVADLGRKLLLSQPGS